MTESRAVITDGVDYRHEWTSPSRPEWVQRVNEEGSCMDIDDVVPLDEESLMGSATRKTGLSDFGDDQWREPFGIFISSLQDAKLNLMGRLRTRADILWLLEGRLQIEDAYKQHPEIEDEQIVEPIVIVGQGRSGTSLLENVLTAHPENKSMLFWEAMFPCPPPTPDHYDDDPRIDKATRYLTGWYRVAPTMESMHEMAGDIPAECCWVMGFNFMAPTFLDTMGQVHSYDHYMLSQDQRPGLRYHQRVLKLLQWKNPRKRWVLKDPMHLYRLPELLEVYPDACVVWPHRDPVRAIASMVNMLGTVQWSRSDYPFQGGSFAYLTDPAMSAARFNAVIDQMESGDVPAKRVLHLYYRDLVRDTLGSVEAIYDYFGLELTKAGRRSMAQYMADNPRDSRPTHEFSAGSEEVVAAARKAFRRYQEHFDIPVE